MKTNHTLTNKPDPKATQSIRNPVVYYESMERELKIRCIYECRCDERLQTKTKEFTRLVYTGLVVELEHLKIIETRLIDEKFANTMGEYVT
jgi:hypothetical protein